MGLVQVATNTVTSAVASITLTGINSDDVYLVAMNNILPDTDNGQIRLRVTTSGTADTSNNYDRAHTVLWSSNTFADVYTQNGSYWGYNQNGTGTGESQNGIMYLFDFGKRSRF